MLPDHIILLRRCYYLMLTSYYSEDAVKSFYKGPSAEHVQTDDTHITEQKEESSVRFGSLNFILDGLEKIKCKISAVEAKLH